jgi:hypothetical protein
VPNVTDLYEAAPPNFVAVLAPLSCTEVDIDLIAKMMQRCNLPLPVSIKPLREGNSKKNACLCYFRTSEDLHRCIGVKLVFPKASKPAEMITASFHARTHCPYLLCIVASCYREIWSRWCVGSARASRGVTSRHILFHGMARSPGITPASYRLSGQSRILLCFFVLNEEVNFNIMEVQPSLPPRVADLLLQLHHHHEQ